MICSRFLAMAGLGAHLNRCDDACGVVTRFLGLPKLALAVSESATNEPVTDPPSSVSAPDSDAVCPAGPCGIALPAFAVQTDSRFDERHAERCLERRALLHNHASVDVLIIGSAGMA